MPELDDSELLAMHAAGMPISSIASELGMSRDTVIRILKEHGRDTSRKPKEVDIDDILTAYQNGQAVPAILAKHQISYSRLYEILRDNDIPTRKAATVAIVNERLTQAVKMYQEGLPLWSIKQETGIAQPTLHAELHRQGINLRRPRMI